MRFWKNTRFRSCALAIVIVACGVTCAAASPTAGLADLRATLRGLNATAAVDGVLIVQSNTTRGKDDSAEAYTANLKLHVRAKSGLNVAVSPQLLRKTAAEKQARAADSSQAAPTAELLNQTPMLDIQNIVSAAPMLLRVLADAHSPSIKLVERDGKSLRKLRVMLPPPDSGDDAPEIDDFASSASFWLDAEGVPVAYAYSFQGEFCKFFLCMTVSQDENATLRVVDGRLVAVKQIKEHAQSGVGQDYRSHTVYTLELQRTVAPPAAATATSNPEP